MSIQDKTTLKGYFETGDIPIEDQYVDLIDSTTGTVQGSNVAAATTYDIIAFNEGATAGNARGENSVDLCTLRSNAAYVPAGVCSMSAAGENNGGTGTHTLYSGYNNHSNTGNYCAISGYYNYSNSGTHCNISGYNNYSNTLGHYCNISGSYNNNNTGNNCSISGQNNYSNSGTHCSISGSYNYGNTGSYCSISGKYNGNNTGDYCTISGHFNGGNIGNSGNYCSISGSYATSNALSYARVHGGNSNARIIDLVAQITTADTLATELLLGGAGGTRIIIPDQSAWNVDVRFVAKTATGAHAAIQNFTGIIMRDGASTTYAAGTSDAAITEIGTDATVTFTVDEGSLAETGATASDTGDKINKTPPQAATGDSIQFTTLTGGTGLSLTTEYYVIGVLSNGFQVSLTKGGAAVPITSDYSDVEYTLNNTLKLTVARDGATNARCSARVQLTQVDY